MSRSQLFRIAVRKYPPFEDAIRAQWRSFEAKAHTGLTLELVPLELRALEEALFASNGMRDGELDVAFVATDWISAMHEARCALDLAPLIAQDPPEDYPGGWTDSLLRLQRIGDNVLGVPYHDGPECLIYRRDLFEDPDLCSLYSQQFGEALTPPVTWQDLHRVARFLHRPERGLFGTVFAAFPDGHNSVYDFLLQVWTRGGDLFDSADRIHFGTREAAEALTFYRAIVTDKQAVHPDCLSLDSVGAGVEFAAGRVAMMVNWFGFATMAQTSNDSAVRGRVGVTDIPHAGNGTAVSLNVYWILSIASGSANQRPAWKFLRHVLTAEMDKLTTMSGAIGCRRSTWNDPQVNAVIPFYHRIEQLHAHAREIPGRPDWPRIAAIIDKLVTATITTDTPVQELLSQADADLATLEL